MITALNVFLLLMAIVVPIILLIGSMMLLVRWMDKEYNNPE